MQSERSQSHIILFRLYEKSKIGKSMTESRLVVAQGWGYGGSGE